MTPSPDALAQLRDIHLPDAVSFWPPAPGWWVLWAGIFVLGFIVAAWLRRRRRSADRVALAALDDLACRYDADHDVSALAVGLSELLRRVALARFDAPDVAALHGAARARSMAGDGAPADLTPELIERLEAIAFIGPRSSQAAGVDAGEATTWLDAARHYIRRRS